MKKLAPRPGLHRAIDMILWEVYVVRTMEFDPHDNTIVQECDLKIHLYPHGGGYIHVMNQDSKTIDFVSLEEPLPPGPSKKELEAIRKKKNRIEKLKNEIAKLEKEIL